MKQYLCIDLKTFYASVECVERGLDPFQTKLVVADPSRGKGAICLAVSPKMKQLGVKNRCRVYEIPSDLSYITALPRMKLYMRYSAAIYRIYLNYISKEDIHVYSIDEAFLDVTNYLRYYQMSARELAQRIVKDIYDTYGITATVGIGTNLYLAKVALDISAKHNHDHMAMLDEESYRATLWNHTPLSDFWMVSKGTINRLAQYNIHTMQDITKANPKILYKEFGVNAEYLIDHAYGKEPTTIRDIKRYQPKHNSISNNQILFENYHFDDALLVLKEMVELNVLTLIERHLVTNHISIHVGYGDRTTKSTTASKKIKYTTNSLQILKKEFIDLFEAKVYHCCPIRAIGICFGNVKEEYYEAYDLFIDQKEIMEEKKLQQTIVSIQHKYGKNAVLKGMNLLEKATAQKRNQLIGGHNAE